MRILYLSVEVEPFAKVGGLADVAGSLPKALQAMGHDVRIVMPAYGMVLKSPRWEIEKSVSMLPVAVSDRLTLLADVYQTTLDAVPVWMIDGDDFFRDVTRSEEVYTPGRDAYLFFCQAALETCRQTGWIPDVVHANDWHTAFTNVFLREKTDWDRTAGVYTIHNLAYQGVFGRDTVEAAGLSWRTFNMHQLETWGEVNFLKSGCAYADQVNTVSPTYAQEIQTEEFGCRLHGLMRHLAQDSQLRGILNGIDVELHAPDRDPRVPFHFSPYNLVGKEECRAALCHELGLDAESGSPVVGVVSRLSSQKGFDLIRAKTEEILGLGVVLVMLAIGDPVLAAEFREIQAQFPSQFRFVESYDADLAQRVYAGIDIFLMPSSFEPCGLGQMFAMHYGAVPVVRKTGGLADTVEDGKNGFVFEHRDADEFYAAVKRAVAAYRSRDEWDVLVRNGMTQDFGWQRSAARYVEMYEDALAHRGRSAPSSNHRHAAKSRAGA